MRASESSFESYKLTRVLFIANFICSSVSYCGVTIIIIIIILFFIYFYFYFSPRLPQAFIFSSFLTFGTFYFQVNPSKELSVFARLAYDQYEERIHIVEEVDVKKERTFYEYILLYREVCAS